jgi:hypothetical protein
MNLTAYLGREDRVTVNGGRVLGGSGGVVTIPQTDIRPALNSTTYIYLDLTASPVLATSTSGFPASSFFPLATVVTNNRGVITSFTDSRPDPGNFWADLSNLDSPTPISTVQDVDMQDVSIRELGWLDKLKAFFKPRRTE